MKAFNTIMFCAGVALAVFGGACCIYSAWAISAHSDWTGFVALMVGSICLILGVVTACTYESR